MFEATHATLFRLYREGLIDGVRVDHVDGLADPPGYCRRLRARLQELAPRTRQPWLVVEKILGAGERLPERLGRRRHQRLRLHGSGKRAAARKRGSSRH